MIKSMTGFAYYTVDHGGYNTTIEIKSVNHRYLDIQCKLPEEYRFFEPAISTIIKKYVQRGKIEVRISFQAHDQQNENIQINMPLVQQIMQINDSLIDVYPNVRPMSVAEILRFPGVQQAPNSELEPEDILPKTTEQLEIVLKIFEESRKREGIKLAEHLLERLDNMEFIISELTTFFPQLLVKYIEKLEVRLKEAVGSIDNDRLKQEVALFLQRSDIDEEFSRLRTHIDEVRRIIKEGNLQGSIGKRLDFLMQELNREANTLGSKSIATESTQAAVELKVLIEQMREQVQNIE